MLTGSQSGSSTVNFDSVKIQVTDANIREGYFDSVEIRVLVMPIFVKYILAGSKSKFIDANIREGNSDSVNIQFR